MNAHLLRSLLAGAVALAALGAAQARQKPPLVSFVSVAKAAEFDPLAAGDNLRPNERAFLRMGIELCRQQARVARLGASQGTNADVRTFAGQVAGDCTRIADSLESLARRKSVALPPMPENPATEDTYTRLIGLTGDGFDREFVRVMFANVDEVIKVFDQTTMDAKDGDVRDFAAAQAPALRDHSNRVRELRKALE